MKKKLIILLIIIIIALAGCFIYFKIDNNKYLFKAYLEENEENYTLVIKNKDYFSFNKMWKIEESKDNHFKLFPWTQDSRASKITKVDIQDNIKLNSLSLFFYNLENLKEIKGLEKIDTSNLTSTSSMFYNCKSLSDLDLSTLNMSKVKIADYMFANCENLSTIYVSQNWNTSSVEESTGMFKNCKKIVGSNGTEYEEFVVDKSFAQVDDLDNAGYLTFKE